jgi:gliding motility-associated-like protein
LTQTTFYRVKIAEDAVNLSGSECSNFSEIFEYQVILVPAAVPVSSRVSVCDDNTAQLEVSVANGTVADWYDQPTGGNLLASAINVLQVDQIGMYYVQTRDVQSDCINDNRVAIEFAKGENPIVNSENLTICPDGFAILDPQFSGSASYEWSSGESTPTISVQDAGSYTCLVTNGEGCSSTATFSVGLVAAPEIISLEENGNELTVTTNEGDFMYRYNGSSFQLSNRLDITGLLQVVVEVSDQQNCTIVTETFNRLGIPEFFTPNMDGFNDVWEVGNIAAFPGTQVELYDRYGKLLKVLTETDSSWNGVFNNQPLPSSDYWYRISYENEELKGHFSLKR